MEQSLAIYNVQTGHEQVLCNMREKQYMSGDTRCHFHSRWSRAGDMICFDAIEPAGGTMTALYCISDRYLSGCDRDGREIPHLSMNRREGSRTNPTSFSAGHRYCY